MNGKVGTQKASVSKEPYMNHPQSSTDMFFTSLGIIIEGNILASVSQMEDKIKDILSETFLHFVSDEH